MDNVPGSMVISVRYRSHILAVKPYLAAINGSLRANWWYTARAIDASLSPNIDNAYLRAP
jgi:hypothetical protein